MLVVACAQGSGAAMNRIGRAIVIWTLALTLGLGVFAHVAFANPDADDVRPREERRERRGERKAERKADDPNGGSDRKERKEMKRDERRERKADGKGERKARKDDRREERRERRAN